MSRKNRQNGKNPAPAATAEAQSPAASAEAVAPPVAAETTDPNPQTALTDGADGGEGAREGDQAAADTGVAEPNPIPEPAPEGSGSTPTPAAPVEPPPPAAPAEEPPVEPPPDRPRVAIVQLARSGDIVNILPVAHALHQEGYDVDLIVHRDFAEVLEAVSYVTPVLVDGPNNDPEIHARAAEDSGAYRLVLSTQVNGNPRQLDVECESFIVQNWARAGLDWVESFHELPLVFDRRDAEGEAAAVTEYVPPPDGRPLLAFCLKGYSSPFAEADGFREWLVKKHAGRYRLLDLSDVRLPKVHHLLGLLEAADVLLTVDSLPLHLAYATGTPTIALSRGIPHYNSEPRDHWVGRQFYPVANVTEGRQAIHDLLADPDAVQARKGTLCRPPEAMYRNRIIHAVDWYLRPGDDLEATHERRRVMNARATWDRLANGDADRGVAKADWSIAFHVLQDGQRSSAGLGDPRRLPYIKDVIDFAAGKARHDDEILVFTNADTVILPDAPAEVRKKLADGDCCYSRRVDVSSGDYPYTREQLTRYPRHCGADLFAFRVGWWKQHRDEFPDLLIGCEGWDWVARRILERHNPGAEIDPPVICHERHSPVWAYTLNIHDNPGQVWNRIESARWARANGFADAIYTDGTPWLFKPDETLAAAR
jgi:hypothetical protein